MARGREEHKDGEKVQRDDCLNNEGKIYQQKQVTDSLNKEAICIKLVIVLHMSTFDIFIVFVFRN